MSSLDLVKQLTQQLPLCLNQDRHVLKRQLDRLRSETQKGKNPVEQLNALTSRIEKSVVLQKQTPSQHSATEFSGFTRHW